MVADLPPCVPARSPESKRPEVPTMRPHTAVLSAAAVAAAAGALAVPALSTASAASSRSVSVTRITAQPSTLPLRARIPGSHVQSRRTFFGNSFGVALGHDRRGAVYPVQTGNGGRTWRTDGPALWVPAADAPLAVSTVTAGTRSLQYAYGGGQVVDVTRGGGPIWRRATFPGTVTAVVPGMRRNTLIAYVMPGAKGASPQQYVTTNGGISWRRSTAVVAG